MTERMPAVSLAAVPGRRAQTIELAAEIEQRGFSGLYCPSFGDAMGLCLSIAHATNTIEFGTSIQPIYLQHPVALATSASYLHEMAEGRFRLGVGVTHGPVIKRLGVETGKPLSDMREYVSTMRESAEHMGGAAQHRARRAARQDGRALRRGRRRCRVGQRVAESDGAFTRPRPQ